MKCSINRFFSKCDQILSFLQICSHLLKKPLMEIFFLCMVVVWCPCDTRSILSIIQGQTDRYSGWLAGPHICDDFSELTNSRWSLSSRIFVLFSFSIWVFFLTNIHDSQESRGRGRLSLQISFYRFQSLHRHLDISHS